MSLEIGLAGLSVIVAGVAVWIAWASDRKMKAIANLEFDEKRAMLQQYRSALSVTYNTLKLDQFICDLEAMTNVACYADKSKRTSASGTVDTIIQALPQQVPQATIDALKKLSSRIKP